MPAGERPLSPHLQIYQPQWTWVLSILHRGTGLALVAGTLVLVWWLLALAGGPESFAAVQGFLGSWLGILVLVGWTAALSFHFFAGLRHLVWDTGVGLDLPTVYATARGVAAAAIASTVLLVILGAVFWR